MKTIKSEGPRLFAVKTRESKPEIPPGKMWLYFVRYEVLEYPANDPTFQGQQFKVHDANCEEARMIADLVKA